MSSPPLPGPGGFVAGGFVVGVGGFGVGGGGLRTVSFGGGSGFFATSAGGDGGVVSAGAGGGGGGVTCAGGGAGGGGVTCAGAVACAGGGVAGDAAGDELSPGDPPPFAATTAITVPTIATVPMAATNGHFLRAAGGCEIAPDDAVIVDGGFVRGGFVP